MNIIPSKLWVAHDHQLMGLTSPIGW